MPYWLGTSRMIGPRGAGATGAAGAAAAAGSAFAGLGGLPYWPIGPNTTATASTAAATIAPRMPPTDSDDMQVPAPNGPNATMDERAAGRPGANSEGRMANGTTRASTLFAIRYSLFATRYFCGGRCLTKAMTMSLCAASTALFAVAR